MKDNQTKNKYFRRVYTVEKYRHLIWISIVQIDVKLYYTQEQM